MTQVTLASIAYVATQASPVFISSEPLPLTVLQVRFALSSSATFTRSDTVTDLERFYNSILEFLEDPEEKNEVDALVVWWNR
jgi:hypothetical protein